MAEVLEQPKLSPYKTEGFDKEITARMAFYQKFKTVPIKFKYNRLSNATTKSMYTLKGSFEAETGQNIPKRGKQSFPNDLTIFSEEKGDIQMLYTERYGIFEAAKHLMKDGQLVKGAQLNPIQFEGFTLILKAERNPLKLIEYMLYAAKYRPDLVEEVEEATKHADAGDDADKVMDLLNIISGIEKLGEIGDTILQRRAAELRIGDETRIHLDTKQLAGLFKNTILNEKVNFVNRWEAKYKKVNDAWSEALSNKVCSFNSKTKAYQFMDTNEKFIDGDFLYKLPADVTVDVAKFLRNEYLAENELKLRELITRTNEKTALN